MANPILAYIGAIVVGTMFAGAVIALIALFAKGFLAVIELLISTITGNNG